MDFRSYLTCFWPGLSELWWRGRLSALPAAIGFAIGLNAWLVLRYIYPHWLDPLLLSTAFWLGLIGWLVSTVRSFLELPHLLAPRQVSDQPDRFPEAQAAYLRAQWCEAESLLLAILSIDPRDPPALLLLAGVYRHTERVDSAAALVRELERLEIADHWQIEVAAEMDRIQRQQNANDDESADEGEVPAETDARKKVSNEVSGKSEMKQKNVSRMDSKDDTAAADLTAA